MNNNSNTGADEMKFVTYERNNQEYVGLVVENDTTVLELKTAEEIFLESNAIPNTMLECISLGEAFLEMAEKLQEQAFVHPRKEEFLFPLTEVKLLAPIPRPAKNIFCVGKNYAAHAIEMGSKKDIPEHMIIFTKAPTTVIGPNEKVDSHREITEQLDYEGRLRGCDWQDREEYQSGESLGLCVRLHDYQ